MKRLVYFPSFSAGGIAVAMQKNLRMPGGMGFRYYAEDFPEKYRMNTYLTTAGHFYKKQEYSEKFEFPEDMVIFGDSGGFQIATGNIEYSDETREKIFHWLEANSTVAANLDIPPKGTKASMFDECLEMSLKNFKYFEDNQSGKTKFLNVLHGPTTERYQYWYESVKHFNFNGWGIGLDQRSPKLVQILSSILPLLTGKEHFNERNEWFHYLGVTGTNELLYLEQLQKSLNDVGSHIQVSTDSSSPNMQAKFGGYWIPKGIGYSNIHIPRGKDNKVDYSKKGWLPICNDLDRQMAENYNYDMSVFQEFKSDAYALLVIHNYGILVDTMNLVHQTVNADPYFKENILSTDISQNLKIIDMVVNSTDPVKEFNRNLSKIRDYDVTKTQNSEIAQEFFTF